MTYTVVKARHLKEHYVYLYEVLPKRSWCVVVYGDDDDTILPEWTRYFTTSYTDALHYYNETKENIGKT